MDISLDSRTQSKLEKTAAPKYKGPNNQVREYGVMKAARPVPTGLKLPSEKKQFKQAPQKKKKPNQGKIIIHPKS